MASKPIFVTQPFLPPLEDFLPYLEEIWQSRRLTNGGPFHERLEAELAEYLGVPHVALLANGTLALLTALQALRITGEVITTPYTFAATSHALLWNGIKPVFVDIDPLTCNLDANQIEAAINSQTTAILPVHCYGNPCDTERIQTIADTYGLKVVYDAAHAFGVKWHGQSLAAAGDASVLSFHATKIFNTFEGGAIVCHDPKLKQRIDYLKNFGFADEVTVVAPGINGKMNEFQAALGLLQLGHVKDVIARRTAIVARYREALSKVAGIRCIETPQGASANHAYFPIIVGAAYPLSRDALYDLLGANNIFARRYFYPLVSAMPMYRGLSSAAVGRLPIASEISLQVLCLPIYPSMENESVDEVAEIISNPMRPIKK